MPKYKNPPIIEAVFDIKIDPVLGFPAKDIEKLHAKISDSYPIMEPQSMWEAMVEFKEGVPAKSEAFDKGICGYRFWNSSRNQACLCRVDGFTFSRLKPYNSWEESFQEALRLWSIYQQNLKPDSIKRIAIRYINSIEIPAVKFELADYFVDPPKPPAGLPQDLDEFLTRFVIRFSENMRAIVMVGVQPPDKPNTTRILLDIDVFAEVKNNMVSADSERVKNIFSNLREIKNRIFEETLQDKTKEFFNE